MTLSQILFSFEGRITRSDYWIKGVLVLIGAIIVVGIVSSILPASLAITLSVLANLAIIWPALALGVKRLRDRGRSPWLILLNLVPIVNLWIFVEVGFLRGTVGPNQYGPDPLGAATPPTPIQA